MANRYVAPEEPEIARYWHVGADTPLRWTLDMFPGAEGPFIRAARDPSTERRELVVGQWALIPWFAKERKLKFLTCNARSEELSEKATFKHPWARGQRCIIPAASFIEPCWETGRHIPWRFTQPNGEPWGLAGLWNIWTDKATGELVESYTMLTVNADAHPLMNRMHRPDLQRPLHMQDKRTVIPIGLSDVDAWLFSPVAEAEKLMRLAPADAFEGRPLGI